MMKLVATASNGPQAQSQRLSTIYTSKVSGYQRLVAAAPANPLQIQGQPIPTIA